MKYVEATIINKNKNSNNYENELKKNIYLY